MKYNRNTEMQLTQNHHFVSGVLLNWNISSGLYFQTSKDYLKMKRMGGKKKKEKAFKVKSHKSSLT